MSAPVQTEGYKADEGKPRVSLIPPEAIIEIARVLTQGGAKYGDRNWEKGMSWSRPYDAIMRHMLAFWGGEDNDPESGLPHLAHACCSAMFLLTYMRTHRELDNRPTIEARPGEASKIVNAFVANLYRELSNPTGRLDDSNPTTEISPS